MKAQSILVNYIIVASSFISPAVAGITNSVEWTRFVQTTNIDGLDSIAIDSNGYIYAAGTAGRSLTGQATSGFNGVVVKYSPQGDLQWIHQVGTTSHVLGDAISVDSFNNVYFASHSTGSIAGPAFGQNDFIISKIDPNGNELWARQIGSNQHDVALSIDSDVYGNTYISGQTAGNLGQSSTGGIDAFLMKLDPSGNTLWTEQFGTPEADRGTSVSVDDSGNAFVGGYTSGALSASSFGMDDAFLTKFNAEGDRLWSRQFGTPDQERGFGVAADSAGNAYLTGISYGSSGTAAYLNKYDSDGHELWSTWQESESNYHNSRSVAVDESDDVYISGVTNGSLGGVLSGSADAFISKYNELGELLWVRQTEMSGYDVSYDVAISPTRDVYITGQSRAEPSDGYQYDGFVSKFVVPEPVAIECFVLGLLHMVMCVRRMNTQSQ